MTLNGTLEALTAAIKRFWILGIVVVSIVTHVLQVERDHKTIMVLVEQVGELNWKIDKLTQTVAIIRREARRGTYR